jgi:serine/threonine protein phosphatase PrpC
MDIAVRTHSGGKKNYFNQDCIVKVGDYGVVCCDGHGKQRISRPDGVVGYLNSGGYAAYVACNHIAENIGKVSKTVFHQAHQVVLFKIKEYFEKQDLNTRIVDKKVLEHYDNYRKKWKNSIGGTTATSVRFNPVTQTVNVANVGDCTAVLFEGDQHMVLTGDHSPHSYDEFLRLEDTCNFYYGVTTYRGLDTSYPLYSEDGIEKNPVPARCSVKNARNEAYVLVSPKGCSSGLNMTRSLGDFSLSAKGISQEPFVKQYPVRPGQTILVGSDGFFDNYTYYDLAQIVQRHNTVDANQLVEVLQNDALGRQKKRYRDNGDNLSIGVMKLKF